MNLAKRITGFALLLSLSINSVLAQSVVINEFMAENDTLTMITDEAYQYDDWIELFNLSNNPVDLSGYFLTDKANELNKWEFPNGTIIPANGYLVAWADNDEGQGVLHTNFKLSKDGEFIALSSPNLTILDSISFGEQEKSVSMARLPNGTGNFVKRAPTFSTNNNGPNSVNPPLSKTSFFQLYPNPTTDRVHIALKPFAAKTIYQISINDVDGKVLFSGKDDFFKNSTSYTLDLGAFPPGVYFLQLQNETTRFIQKLIIL